jgi:hydrogenase-4 component B
VLFAWTVSGLRMLRMLRIRRVPAWKSATIGVEGADFYTVFGYANPTLWVPIAGLIAPS